MTQNLLTGAANAANTMQGLRMNANQERQLMEQQQREAQAREAQAQQMQMVNDLKVQYGETGDPAIMRQLILADPNMASQIQNQFGVVDDQTKAVAMNEAATLKRMLETNPDEAIQYWQQNLAQNPAFAGLADNFQANDFEGAMNEIGWGVTALGGDKAYQDMFGSGVDKTDFVNDLIVAGIKPGSEEFKSAVLEKYGKGDTIGYDVIEGVNPETGDTEFFQVSRVNPNDTISLGIKVPKTAAQLKKEAEDAAASDREKETITGTLTTLGKILTNPGLSGFSGLDSFKRFLPGSEAANVSAYIDQLQSQNFLTSVAQMKGMGALSENEGRKLSAAVAAISPMMSDEAVLAELQTIESNLLTALDRIENNTLLDVNGTQDTPTKAEQPTVNKGVRRTVNWSELK